MALSIFLVAGEASADSHGAALVREMKKTMPSLNVWGIGSQRLRAEGMETLIDATKLNVVGVFDWLDRWRELYGEYRRICKAIEERRPDVAILLDLPDFNLMLAKRLRRAGIPIAYYISPQVWAWRKYRIRKIRRLVDKMIVLFPFEERFYKEHGVPVVFAGHPLRETIEPRLGYRDSADIAVSPRVALLPGSRGSELKYHGPILNEVAQRLVKEHPTIQLRLPVAPTLSMDMVRAAIPCERVELIEGDTVGTLAWADVALVASGTATLETALVGTPFAIHYVISPTSMGLARIFIRYRDFFGITNWLHGREVIREFIQEKATPEALVTECRKLLFDDEYRRGVISVLGESHRQLGDPGASARAATAVWDLIRAKRAPESGSVLAAPQPA